MVNEKIVSAVAKATTASILSGESLLLIGSPGGGKTVCLLEASRRTGAKTGVFFITASTQPERVVGHVSIPAMKDGRWEVILDGSVLDPTTPLIIADEIGRGNDAVFDGFMQAMTPADGSEPKVVWGTTNFVPKGARNEAIWDRFGLTVWADMYLQPDVEEVVMVATTPGSSIKGLEEVPSWDVGVGIRNEPPTVQMLEKIVEVTQRWRLELGRRQIVVTPRHMRVAARVLKGVSMYKKESPSSKEVMEYLAFAYPSTSIEVATAVRAAVESLNDIDAMTSINAAIDDLLRMSSSTASVTDFGFALHIFVESVKWYVKNQDELMSWAHDVLAGFVENGLDVASLKKRIEEMLR